MRRPGESVADWGYRAAMFWLWVGGALSFAMIAVSGTLAVIVDTRWILGVPAAVLTAPIFGIIGTLRQTAIYREDE